MTQEAIEVRGARVNNLKNISSSIPVGRLTVVTGVSGSGKSSLAFDTIYAEGQRRYVESLSAYARQFLERMDKPDVDEVRGIAPAIAIRQKNSTRNPRSTVGTQTEVYDYLRLLYARVGTTICRVCGREVHKDSPESSAHEILNTLAEGTRFYVLFPAEAGLRVETNGNGTQPKAKTRKSKTSTDAGALTRQQIVAHVMSLMQRGFTRLYSKGAIEPWTKPQHDWARTELRRFCKQEGIPMDVPFAELSSAQKRAIIEGKGQHWAGVRGFFAWLETKKYKLHVRVFLAKYRGYTRCPDCNGGRLRQEARDVRVGDRTLPEVSSFSIKEAAAFFDSLELTPEQSAIADRVLFEIRRRLRFLVDVGLDYLTLDRLASTLSGGEAQRIQLATNLGSSLVGALDVLDEPSIGLH